MGIQCAVSMIGTRSHDCVSFNCSAWDAETNRCLISAFLQSYVKNQLQALEMLKVAEQMSNISDKMEEVVKDAENESREDDE